tara:strand:+ start:14413 stop:15066 length:654 start_codon:yes stop_codon:yes gene_type:complete
MVQFSKEQESQINLWCIEGKIKDTILKQTKEHNEIEKEWGNKMIEQKNNGQWTTNLGEHYIYQILKELGKNPRRPETKGHYRPDIETDDVIYEIKTRNYTTPGTAGEKVYGVPLKYAEVPSLYNKPLKIVCVGYQERELTEGYTPIFGNIRSIHKEILEYFQNKHNIEFIKASDLIKQVSEQRLQRAEDFNVNSNQDIVKEPLELIGESFQIQINKK